MVHFDEHLYLAANETPWILTIQNAYLCSLSIKCGLILSVMRPKLKIKAVCILMSIFILLLMKHFGYRQSKVPPIAAFPAFNSLVLRSRLQRKAVLLCFVRESASSHSQQGLSKTTFILEKHHIQHRKAPHFIPAPYPVCRQEPIAGIQTCRAQCIFSLLCIRKIGIDM